MEVLYQLTQQGGARRGADGCLGWAPVSLNPPLGHTRVRATASISVKVASAMTIIGS